MGQEIERKYLVDIEQWKKIAKPKGENYRQGYLLTDSGKTIRVRVTPDKAFLTIKGITHYATRSEFEYEIPVKDANELLEQFSVSELTKIRYKIIYQDKLWEIDEFLGENSGLIIAEIELIAEDEKFQEPVWVSKEVTGDAKYYNANLAKSPFNTW